MSIYIKYLVIIKLGSDGAVKPSTNQVAGLGSAQTLAKARGLWDFDWMI
jgi:hypothetical protein